MKPQFTMIGMLMTLSIFTGAYFLRPTPDPLPPPASTATQAIPASFDIDATGDATWSMPIAVPPGTHGVQPALSVDYASNSLNGLLGVGFELQGMAAITRVGASPAQDGYRGGITYSSKDRFAFNGQRLMVTSGSYGASNSIYQTERQSWVKVQANSQSGSGPQSFSVTMKNGSQLQFGQTTDSRVAARGPGISGSKAGSVRQWLLNQYTDLNGNSIQFQYADTPLDSNGRSLTSCTNQGQQYPSQILYTINGTHAAQRKVKFFYEYRPDSATVCLGGGCFSTKARLNGIRTYVNNAQGQETEVRRIRISYDPSAPLSISRITRINVCAGTTCLNPTQFTWSTGPNTFLTGNVNWTGPGSNNGFIGDFNGDGRSDIYALDENKIYVATSTGFSGGVTSGAVLSNTQANFVGDFNGDGISDVLAAGSTLGTIYYGQNGRLLSPGTSVSGMNIANGCYPNECVWQGDFNGDGLSDIAAGVQSNVYFSFGRSSGGFAPTASQSAMAVNKGKTFAADFNGDGLTDLFSCDPGTGYLSISNYSDSTGFRRPITITGMNFIISPLTTTWIADFNGDGMADILAKGSDASYRLYIAHGVGFRPGLTISGPTRSTLALWPADYNNDGKMDFCTADGLGENANLAVTTYLSNGRGFQSGATTTLNFTLRSTYLGDFNGDGLPDLMNTLQKKIANGGNTSSPTSNQNPNLLTGINNGMGSTLAITYRPITDATVYSPGPSSNVTAVEGTRLLNTFNPFPLANTQNPSLNIIPMRSALYVVSAWQEGDGRGSTYSHTCNYTGAKLDLSGYGFLGFRSQSTTTSSLNQITKVVYNQTFPYTGLVDSILQTDDSHRLYAGAYTPWRSTSTTPISHSTVYNVYQTSKNNYEYSGNTLLLHTQVNYWYDSYGNCRLIQNKGNVNNPHIVYTKNTYDNNSSQWQLGYLTASVQSADSNGNNPLSSVQLTYTTDGKRDLQRLQTWNSQGNVWLSKYYGYDQFGNQIYNVGYANDTSFTRFEHTYYTFPDTSLSPPNDQGHRLRSTATYDPAYGNVLTEKDPNGNLFSKTYDGLGRLLTASIPQSNGQSFTGYHRSIVNANSYGFAEQVIITRDWNAWQKDTLFTYYDALSRPFQTKRRGWGQQWVLSTQSYNAADQIVSSTLPTFSGTAYVPISTVTYDPIGRPTYITRPFKDTESITERINYMGTSMSIQKAFGTSEEKEVVYNLDYYNGQAKISFFGNEAGQESAFQYDLLGRMTMAQDPQHNTTRVQFNSLNEPNWYYNTASDTTFMTYTPQQNKLEILNNKGVRTTINYDNLGRVLQIQPSIGNPITYEYDLNTSTNGQGHLCKVLLPERNAQITYAYTTLDEVSGTTYTISGKSWQELNAYNADGSLATTTFPDGSKQTISYSSTGQASTVNRVTASNATTRVVLVDGINAMGQWTEYAYSNNLRTQKGYYYSGQLKTLSCNSPNSGLLLSKSYDWNYRYRISSVQDLMDSQRSEIYSYDPTNRLTKVQTGSNKIDSLAYDTAGNLIWADSTRFSYQHYQVHTGTKGSTTVLNNTYDPCGNLVSRQVGDHDRTDYRYTFNAFNELDSVYRNDTLMYTYQYDHEGNRLVQEDVQAGTTTYYIGSQFSQVYADNYARSTTIYYSLGGAVFATFSTDNLVGTQYYTVNQNGSTILATDSYGRAIVDLDYAPYGQPATEANANSTVPFKFNGKRYDPKSGLYDFGPRHYDPITGRFISPDNQLAGGSIAVADAFNLYAFVRNSPITMSDPSGHNEVGTSAGISVVVDAVVDLVVDEVLEDVTLGMATPFLPAADALLDAGINAGVKVTEDVAKAAIKETGKDVATQIGNEAAEDLFGKVGGKRGRKVLEEPIYYEDSDEEDVFSDSDSEEEDDDDEEFTIETIKKKKVPRPGFRKGVVDEVWANAQDENGRVFCPNTHKELFWDRTKSRQEQWHMGHLPGKEYRDLYKSFAADEIEWQDVIEEYNDPANYAPEDPDGNRSHAYEKKADDGNKANPKKQRTKGP